MFQRLWIRITARKHRLLSHFMLAGLAGWALLQFDLPTARAQRRMMGTRGGMMRPAPSMMMRPMNASGMGFSGGGMRFSANGMGSRMGMGTGMGTGTGTTTGMGMGTGMSTGMGLSSSRIATGNAMGMGTGMGLSGARMGTGIGTGFSGTGMGFSGAGMGFPGAGMGFSGTRMGTGTGAAAGSSGAGLGSSGGGNGYSGAGSSGGSQYGTQSDEGYGGSILDGSSYGTSGLTGGYGESESTSSQHSSSMNAGLDQAYQQRAAERDAREEAKRRAADEAQNAREAALAEENRQRAEREQLEHSLHNPSAAEIRSGKALNEILADLQNRSETAGLAVLGSSPLPLDEADLAHINVSARAGSIGLLKNAGHVNWPTALSGSDFAADRERLTRRTSEAIQKIKARGLADGAALEELQGDLYSLYKRFRNQGTDFPPSQYREGLIFLRDFQSAVKGLWQLDVANQFNGKYALKAKSVGTLVKHMTERRLHFAPAVSGDEPAYAMLHGVLADYDRAVEQHRR